MKASIHLGTVWGIPIGLHVSWFLVFGLVLFSLSSGYFPAEYPGLSMIWHVALAAVTTVLFFGSVQLHELGHALLALRNRLPVRGITLFIFGGVAQIGREPQTAGAEFRIAIAGPLVSLGLAAFFGVTYLLDQQIPYLAAPSLYLMRINLMLALFNMIPGFPLDGGRVLRAIVWKLTGSYQRATQLASASGQLVAFGFIGWGVYTVFTGEFLNGLWLAFIGWFLQNAAASAGQQVSLQEQLRGITVAQAMSRDAAYIPALTPLSQLVQERVLGRGQHTFFVTDFAGQAVGLLTLQEITRVPQVAWRTRTAGQAMTPLAQLRSFEAGEDLLAVIQAMEEAEIPQAAVVSQGQPVGLISHEQAQRYLQMKTQLGM